MSATSGIDLTGRCDQLRSLHTPGTPLLLPNAWDVATAKAVVAAGFPAVATTSWGVAEALGYTDHEGAPGEEMLAAAGRMVRAVDVPVTVDAEAAYGMSPEEIVAGLHAIGAAGCNLEDTDHATDTLRDAAEQADWLRAARRAADDLGYGLVINARIDVFLGLLHEEAGPEAFGPLVPAAAERANLYLEAGADCVYPLGLAEPDQLRHFLAEAPGTVNVTRMPGPVSLAELADMGVARISWGPFLYLDAMAGLAAQLDTLRA